MWKPESTAMKMSTLW